MAEKTARNLTGDLGGRRLVLLLAVSLGHVLMHCFQYGWYIVLPSVKGSLALSDVQYGAVESVRSLSSGLTNIPAGAVSDLLRRQWASILTFGLATMGLAYFLLGIAPDYPFVLLAAVLVGISISLWHPPALATLSASLRDRLGFALSVHGMGGEIGNTIGPLALGFLIGTLPWRNTTQMLAIPVVIFAIGLWLVLRNFPGREGPSVGRKQYLAAINGLLKNKVIIGILLARGVLAMGTGSVFAFYSLYLQQDLGFAPSKTGLYYAILMASGIVSQPFMGYLSDRVGRKAVIVPSVLLLGLSTTALLWAGDGVGLVVVSIVIGLFIYSISAIIQAAAMDVTDESTGAMTIALLFASSSLFAIPSPLIAGALSSTYGTASVFPYSGALIALGALIMLPLPMGAAHNARPGERPAEPDLAQSSDRRAR